MDASLWAYHFSIISVFFVMIRIPYTAQIIAYEKMNAYAYISIFEVSAQLCMVYMLNMATMDKLILYAFLLCVIQLIITSLYWLYCKINIPSAKYHLVWDRAIFKNIISFSGWNMFSQASIALNSQGTTIITNMFFSPAVVAARALSNQVNMAANQLVGNFRTAINPQIVKKYASGDHDGSRSLMLESTKYSYFLMLLIGLPIILVANNLLVLWLKIVPEYTVVFLQLAIVHSLFSVFDTSFYAALYAKGRLRENALVSPTIGFLCFPVVYLLFKAGFSPIIISYANIATYFLLGIIIKPILIIRIAGYSLKEVIPVFVVCLRVTVISAIIPIFLVYILDSSTMSSCLIVVVAIISTFTGIYFTGINHNMRMKVLKFAHRNIISLFENFKNKA
jgi:O-antigen/teichoic acid export membrane protein